jgi:fibronectin-binding autotransporter adhesin
MNHRVAFLLLAGSLALGTAEAQIQWTGGADTTWTNESNWFFFAPPLPGEDVAFDANATANLSTRLGADFAINSLSVVNPAGNVSIASNTLSIGAGGIAMSLATVNLAIASAVVPAAAQDWDVASGRTLTVSGPLQGTNAVTKKGQGALVLGGVSSNFTGGLVVEGGDLTVGALFALGTADTLVNAAGTLAPGIRINTGNGVNLANTFVLQNLGAGSNVVGSLNAGGNDNSGNLRLRFDLRGRDLVIDGGSDRYSPYSGFIRGTGDVWIVDGRVDIATATNTWVGALRVPAGGIYQDNSNEMVPDTADLYIDGTFQMNTALETVDALSGTGLVQNITGGTRTLIVGADGGSGEFSGRVRPGAGGGTLLLVKTGAGTQVLAGLGDNDAARVTVNNGTLVLAKTNSAAAHAASIDVTVNGGTLQLAGTGGDQIWDGSTVSVEGGVFDLNGLSEAIGPLQGGLTNGTILNSAAGTLGVLTVGTNNGSGAYYGSIAQGVGTVRVVKVGTGTQLFGGNVAVDYLIVSNGIVQIGGGPGSWSFAGEIVNEARVDFASRGLVLPPAITGTGAVHVVGPYGGVLFTNTASFTGPLTVSGGFVQFGNCTAGGELGTTLNMASGTLAFARSDNVTWSTAITGGVNVLKLCDSTLTLDAANTYSGGTRVAAGTVLVSGSLGPQRYLSILTNASLDAGTAALTIAPSGRLAIAGNRIDTWEGGRLQVSRPAGGSLTNADIQLVMLGGTFDLRGGDATAPLFPNNDLTNQLAFWLRADAGVQTDGGYVTNWLDSSKYARDMRVTGSRPPFVPALAELNNRPVVRCTGLNRFKTADITNDFPARNCSIFIVAKATNNFSVSSYFLTMVTTSTETEPAQRWILHFPWSDGNVYMGVPYGNWLNYQPGAAAMSQFNLWFMRNSGGGQGRPRGRMIVRNGAVERADGVAPEYVLQPGRHLTLAGYGATGGWQGELAELMIFTNALSRTEEEQVGHYLARKYAFEGVYADQPAAQADLNLAAATLIVSNSSAFFGANATTIRVGAVELRAGVTSTFHHTIANFVWPDNGFLPGTTADQTQIYPAFATYDMPISGPGAVVITNGITRFAGNSLHTYSGGLYLQNYGRLVLAKTNGANNAIPTNVFLNAAVWNTGAGSFHGGIELESDEQIPDDTVIATGGGQWNALRTYGHTETIAGVTGTYMIVEDSRFSDTNGHGMGHFIVSNDAARTYHGIIRDNDGGTNRLAFTKRGGGTLTFATGGDWLNWSGPTRVEGGELILNNNGNPINGSGTEWNYEVFANATLTYGNHNHHGQWNAGQSANHTIYEGGVLRNNGAWVNVLSNVTLCGGTWSNTGGYDANQKAWSIKGTLRVAGTNTTSWIVNNAAGTGTYWGINLGSGVASTNILDVSNAVPAVALKVDAGFFDAFNNLAWPAAYPSTLRKIGDGTVLFGRGQGFTGPLSVEAGSVIVTNGTLSGELALTNGTTAVLVGGIGLPGEFKQGFSAFANIASLDALNAYWATNTPTHLYNSCDRGYNSDGTFNFGRDVNTGYSFQPPFNRNNGQIVFEARWRGTFVAASAGTYTFGGSSDDGFALYIDGTNVFATTIGTPSGSIGLAAGEHAIVYAYYNSGGDFGLKGTFTPPGGSLQGLSNLFLRGGTAIGGLSGAPGTLLVASNGLLHIVQRSDRTFGGDIRGNAGLLKSGKALLALAGTNTYSGGTEVRGGTLQLASAGAFAGAALLVEDGTFDLNGYSITCTNFDGARGTLTNSAATPVMLTLNPGDGNREVFLGNLGGEIGLTKSGTNLLWLGGANAHNGPFAINGGVLRYDGQNSGTSAVTMAAGTILCGTGSLGGAVSVPNGSFIGCKPAFAPTGTLSMTSLSLSGGATISAFLNGTNPTIRVTEPGGFATGGTTNRIELVVAGGLGVGTYPLIDYAGSIGGGGFGALVLAGLPPGVTGALNNNAIDGVVELTVTAVDQLRWTGAVNGLWDTNTLNWVTAGGAVTNYYEGVGVLFNDLGNNVAITVQTNGVAPGSITVSNLTKVYSWGGGAIGGLGGIQKLGQGMLIVSNANTFLDDVVISNGTIRVASATALGSLSGGTFVRSGGALDLFGQSIGKERVHLAGTGVTNEGCYYNTAAYINGRGTNTPGWIRLLADATISGGPSGFEWGRDAGKAMLDWNGYRLTKIGAGNIWIIQCVLSNAGDTVFTGAGVNLGLDDISNPAFVTNTWGVGDGSILYFYSDDGVRDDYPMDIHLTNASLWANGGNQYPNLMRTIYLEGATNWLRGGGAGFITGSIVGTSRLARAETGWWAISSTNTYTGGTLLNAGEFILGYGINNAPTNSGSLVGDIILNGGVFNYAHAIPQTVTNNLIGLGNAVNGYVNSRMATGLTFDASATVNMTSQVLRAGTYNYGQMFFRTGCAVNAYGLYIADLNNTAGDVTMDGGAVNLSGNAASSFLRIGSQANTGSLRMQGGLLTISNSQLSVGWDGTGILYLQGGEVVARSLQLNANTTNGYGRLIVEGGRLSIGAGGFLAPGGPATNFLGGGTIGALENWAWDSSQPGYLSGTNGHTTFDSSTNTIAVNGWLTGTGGVNKIGAGRLLLNGTNTFGGALVVSNGSLFGAGSVTAPVLVRSNATLGAASGTPAGTLTLSNVTLESGAALGGLINGTNPALRVTGALSNGAVTLVRVFSAAPAAPGTYPLVDYTGTLAGVFGSAFQLQPLPAGVQGYLTNNTTETRIDLVVTNVAGFGLKWFGDVDSNWDNGLTANWRDSADGAAVFNPSDAVLLDDTATNFVVSLAVPVEPVSVLISNVTQTYQLGGPGAIAGAATLTKVGTGTVVIVNTNTHSGATTIGDGTLQVGNGGTSGDLLASTVTVTNAGTLAHFRADAVSIYRVPMAVRGNGTWLVRGPGLSTIGDYLITNNNAGFTGTLTIDKARFQADAVTDAGYASINVLTGGQFWANSAATYSNAIAIAGQGWQEGALYGALRLQGGATYGGPIVLANGSRIGAINGIHFVTSNISGPFDLEGYCGPSSGELRLSGHNTFNNLRPVAGWTYADRPDAIGTGTLAMAGGGFAAFNNALTITNALRAESDIHLGYGNGYKDLAFLGPWDLNGGGRNCNVYNTTTVFGAIGGTNGGLYKYAHGRLVLRGTNALLNAGYCIAINPAGSVLSMEGDAVTLCSGYVGWNGAGGTLVVSNNAVLECTQFWLGQGGNNRWGVFDQYGGTVRLNNAGTDAFNQRVLIIGEYPGATSYVNLHGGTLLVTNGQARTLIGQSGGGLLRIHGGLAVLKGVRALGQAGGIDLDGGELRVGGNGIDWTAGPQPAINLGGGTLSAYENWASSVPMVLNGTNGNTQVNGLGYTIGLSGALTGTGRLDKVGTGTLAINGAYGAGAIAVSGGTLGGTGTINAAVTVGAGAGVQPGYLTAPGALVVTSVSFGADSVLYSLVNGTASLLRVTGTNGLTAPAGAGAVTVTVQNASLPVGTYTLLDYAGAIQGGSGTNFVLGPLPPHMQATLTNNEANTSIDLLVTVASDTLKWTGSLDANWNIDTTTNWATLLGGLPAVYLEVGAIGDAVLFDDSAAGNFDVLVAQSVMPSGWTVSNETQNYSIGGQPITGDGGAGQARRSPSDAAELQPVHRRRDAPRGRVAVGRPRGPRPRRQHAEPQRRFADAGFRHAGPCEKRPAGRQRDRRAGSRDVRRGHREHDGNAHIHRRQLHAGRRRGHECDRRDGRPRLRGESGAATPAPLPPRWARVPS